MQEEWAVWYENLKKPFWTPGGDTISLIWTILYPIIIGSFLFVLWRTVKGKMDPIVLTVYSVNLLANVLFMPVFSGMRNLPLAALLILTVWVTIIFEIVLSWKYSKILSLIQVPYLIWVSVATVLMLSIVGMN